MPDDGGRGRYFCLLTNRCTDMDIEAIREFCLSKKGTSEDFPFDEHTLCLRVMGKIFALLPLDAPTSINLKCDPDWALELRERHPEVQPGFHMNKRMWNTVGLEGALGEESLKAMITHSYEQVVKGLKKSEKAALEAL